MSIAIHVHGRADDAALAELIAAAIHEGGVFGKEPQIAHLSALLESEERAAEAKRAQWRWLNSVSTSTIDRDNDWSNV